MIAPMRIKGSGHTGWNTQISGGKYGITGSWGTGGFQGGIDLTPERGTY